MYYHLMPDKMKILHVAYLYDESLTTEEEVLEQYYTITGWAEALQRKGVEVTVMYRFKKESSFQKNGVQYHFIKDKLGGTLRGWNIPLKFLKKINTIDADVIHLHHLTLSLQTLILRFLVKKKTRIIIQHHGGKLPGKKKRFLHNVLNSVADGFFFTTTEQGDEWFMKKKPFKKTLPVMEGATYFDYPTRDNSRSITYTERFIARAKTGMTGNPVFLWVGRLDDNKDPLTILNGFEVLAEKYPDSTLHMIYSDGKLTETVKKKIEMSQKLKAKVYLHGKIDHKKMEAYYNSADYFVLGSHYEGSGYALSEALRCGCIPVITSIPSFRMMTDNGRIGSLWKTGDKNSFIEAAEKAMQKPLDNEIKECLHFFEKKLSFDSIAATAILHYQKIIKR
ncbi:MAG: glycosyltransferase family 4 protein [Bacteroidota bacterium]